LRIGTSGWSYKEWEKVFYPAGEKAKLPFYTKHFDTVEIDSTFYAYPSSGMVSSWARNSPAGFVFSAKLPKLITHEKKLDVGKGTEGDLVKFLSVMRPLILQKKLGPLLIQLPPSFSFDEDFDRLEGFLKVLPHHVRFAIEFRDRSWLRPDTWDLLRRYKVANTIVDEPLLPPDVVVTTDFSFVRWHGQGSQPWYNYRYKEKELEPWKARLEEVMAGAKDTYGYFNNHFRGNAIENALQMGKIMGQEDKEQLKTREQVTRRLDAAEAGRPDPDQGRL
jgi:uncharacterized protein YecE (DUF72 family)